MSMKFETSRYAVIAKFTQGIFEISISDFLFDRGEDKGKPYNAPDIRVYVNEMHDITPVICRMIFDAETAKNDYIPSTYQNMKDVMWAIHQIERLYLEEVPA